MLMQVHHVGGKSRTCAILTMMVSCPIAMVWHTDGRREWMVVADGIMGITRKVREREPLDGDKPVQKPNVPMPIVWAIAIVIPFLVCLSMQPSALMTDTVMAKPSSVSEIALDGMHETGDGTYVADSDAPSMTVSFDKPFALNTMTMRLKPQDDSEKTFWQHVGFDAGDILTITASTRVVGSDEYTLPRTQTLLSDNAQTETLMLRTASEQIDSVRIEFPDTVAGDKIVLDAPLSFNDRIPETPYLPCLFLLLVMCAALVLLRPSSIMSCYAYRNHRRLGHIALAVMVASLCVLSVAVTHISETHDEVTYNETFKADMDPNQYQHVTDAIMDGHAYLGKKPPKWLADADNPYDYEYRHDKSEYTGVSYLFDYAFHNGRYYSYDGILPVLVMFLPYRLVTGTNMTNAMAMDVMGCVGTVVSVFLGVAVMRRHRRDASVSECLVAGFAMWLCTCILWLCFYPTVYHEVIIIGTTAAEAGIGLWIVADGPLPRRNVDGHTDGNGDSKDTNEIVTARPMHPAPLAIGSLLVGATLLARPTLFLCALLAFPIFGHRFFRRHGDDREFFGTSRHAVLNTLIVIVPILLCAGVALWWNYARFGNALDFGYKYNLTGFDMVNKPFSKRRVAFGVLMYIFAPLRLTRAFPFFSAQWTYGWYQFLLERTPGVVQEPYYGGVIAFFPFLLCTLAIFGKGTRKAVRGRGVVSLVITCLAIAVVIMAFDSSTAITQRYLADFAWLIGIAAIAAMASCAAVGDTERGHYGETLHSHAPYVMLLLCLVSFLLVMINLLATDRYSALNIWNPQVWWSCWSWFLGIY